jgi:hypothetical protein
MPEEESARSLVPGTSVGNHRRSQSRLSFPIPFWALSIGFLRVAHDTVEAARLGVIDPPWRLALEEPVRAMLAATVILDV